MSVSLVGWHIPVINADTAGIILREEMDAEAAQLATPGSAAGLRYLQGTSDRIATINFCNQDTADRYLNIRVDLSYYMIHNLVLPARRSTSIDTFFIGANQIIDFYVSTTPQTASV